MSDHTAIMAVSQTLKNLLADQMALREEVTITISAPDATPTASGARLNLFLYHVAENAYLKNQEIPGQGHRGAYGRPPLSLSLHYLMTAYGTSDADDLFPQQLLGDAMRVLHDFPLVTDTMLKENDSNGRILETALQGQFESVKITLQPSSVDDLSKIWTALPEANLRPSVAYEVSVVQIESTQPRTPTLPVLKRQVKVFPLQSPRIVEVFRVAPASEIPPKLPAKTAMGEVGDTIRIVGFNLRGEMTHVLIDDIEASVATLADDHVDVIVPPTVRAGVTSVQVVHNLMLGDPVLGETPVEHRGTRSNVVGLVVLPKLDGDVSAPDADKKVTATVIPQVAANQKVQLLLGNVLVRAEAIHVAPGESPDEVTSPTVLFTLPSPPVIPAGDHLVRVRVDGAESLLTFDDINGFTGPKYTI